MTDANEAWPPALERRLERLELGAAEGERNLEGLASRVTTAEAAAARLERLEGRHTAVLAELAGTLERVTAERGQALERLEGRLTRLEGELNHLANEVHYK